MKQKTIKVKDFIIPESNSQPFYVVISFWEEDKKSGLCFAERIDPRSHFYTPEKFSHFKTSDLQELKEYHNGLAEKLDWRNSVEVKS